MNRSQILSLIGLSLLGLLAFSACGGSTPITVAADAGTPTMHPYFGWGSASPASVTATPPPADPDATPTVFRYFSNTELPTPRPTNTRRPMPTPRPAETPLPTSESAAPTNVTSTELELQGDITIYDDTLDENWTLDKSWEVAYNLRSTEFVHSGDYAISVTPSDAFGAVFFAIDPQTQREYYYADMLAVSFWINPGEQDLPLEDMAITVVGSNEYPYWRADDTSVTDGSGENGFSETRLYYLDFNRSLPAEEWNEVIIWLDNLVYDPETIYITGVYIKNSENYEGTYFIDDIALITQDG